jgi:acetyltransferase
MGHCALEEGGNAEVAVVVADAWQRRGIGTRLLRALAHHASGYEALRGLILAENRAMLALARRLGFRVLGYPEPGLVQVEKLVTPAAGARLAGSAPLSSSRRSCA